MSFQKKRKKKSNEVVWTEHQDINVFGALLTMKCLSQMFFLSVLFSQTLEDV